MRKKLTPFGSKWDGLRNLVKGTETFEKMTASRGFKESLSQATPMKVLGKGAFGTATEMRSSFRGQQFSFVRKTGDIPASEAPFMRQFSDDFAPTVYNEGIEANGSRFIDMEKFHGRDFISDPSEIQPHHIASIRSMVEKMHSKDVMHGDLHLGNIMALDNGEIGIIDFGKTLSSKEFSTGSTRTMTFRDNPYGYYAMYTKTYNEAATFKVAELNKFSKEVQDETSSHVKQRSDRWLRKMTRPFIEVPSSRASHNTIEGMQHGGAAEEMRKITPFGSAWDGLRNLIKGTETFQEMLASTGFKQSLDAAKQLEKLGGSSSFGQAFKMESTFRGQPFQFVRKIGDIQKNEAAFMGKFSDDFAPSVYGHGEIEFQGKYLDMELIQGKTFDAARSDLTSANWKEAGGKLGSIHKQGFVHGDPHGGNMMLTPEGKIAFIDWGGAGKIGERATFIQKGREVSLHGQDVFESANDWKLFTSTAKLGNPAAAEDAIAAMHAAMPGTNPGRIRPSQKKHLQADLQRSASAHSWRNGIEGGRKSRK